MSTAEPVSVYNLSIEGDAHEFFANGVLVHNCDAFTWGHFSLRAMVPAPDMERVHGLGVGEGARWTPPSGDQRRQSSEGQSLWSAPSLNGASQGGPAGGRWSM